MRYYSLPIQPEKLMEGARQPLVNLHKSIKQRIRVIVHTKAPEECTAVEHFGCSIRKYIHAAPGLGEGVEAQFLRDLKRDIKKSLLLSLQACEPRLMDPKVKLVHIVSPGSDDGEEQRMLSRQKPASFWLRIEVSGEIMDSASGRQVSFEDMIELPLG